MVLLRRRGGHPFFHLDDEHLVGLIVTVVKLAVHRELKQGVIALAEHLHLGDRGSKVLHIDEVELIIRHPGTVELGQHFLTTAADIHRRRTVVQRHEELPLPLLATTKIHALDRVEVGATHVCLRHGQHRLAGGNGRRSHSRCGSHGRLSLILGLVLGNSLGVNQCRLSHRLASDERRLAGCNRRRRGRDRLPSLVSQRHQQFIALLMDLIGGELIEGDLDVEPLPLPLHQEVVHPLLLDGQGIDRQGTDGPGYVQQKLIGFIGQPVRKTADRFAEAELQQELIGQQGIHLDLLQRGYCPHLSASAQPQQRHTGHPSYCCSHLCSSLIIVLRRDWPWPAGFLG